LFLFVKKHFIDVAVVVGVIFCTVDVGNGVDVVVVIKSG